MFNRARVVNMLSWCLIFVFIPLSANADTAAESPSCMGTIFGLLGELLEEFILKPILVILWAIFSTLGPLIIPGIILLIILFLLR